MSLFRPLLLLLLASLLSGCIDVETVVYVRADGSGRVEERMLMGAELSALGAQMQMMQGAQGQSSGQPQESGFPFDRKQLEERAGKMGPGVRLASVEPLQDGARQGYRAVFAFDDVNKLQLDENPPAPAIGGPEGETNKETKPSLMTFQFKPGEPAELIVRNAMKPTADAGGGGEGAQDAAAAQGGGDGAMVNAGAQQMPEDPQAMAMMTQMFREMRIALRVEVEGEVVESNALYREGSRVTLVEMDFGKLMGDPKKLNDLMMKNPQTMEEMKALLEGVAGVKVDPQPEVHVRFSGVVVRRAELPAAGAVVAATNPPARRAQRVEVTDARGMTIQGTLVDEPPQLLRLRRPEAEGGMVVELPLSSLRQVRLSGPGL